MEMANATVERAAPTRRSRRSSRRQLAAAARHSSAYRERQRAKGMPTGSDIDAMIASVLVRCACRPQGLHTNATHLPQLCRTVAKEFDVAEELEEELERRVALRVERLRAPAGV